MQVCNGFGPAGHMVSFRVAQSIPKFLFEATEEAHKPSKFESEAIVYEKTKHFAVGPVREMEVAIDAITDWRPL